MQTINSNLSSLLLQLSQTTFSKNIHSDGNNFANEKNNMFVNDTAFSFIPDLAGKVANYDESMNNVAYLKDMILTAQDDLKLMRNHGESIRDLVSKAKEEGITEETLDAIQKEVNARIAEIGRIKENASWNGINPFENPFSICLPQWQDMLGVNGVEQVTEDDEMKDVLASISFDMTVNGDSQNGNFAIGASATINIGVNKDGALEISVDASFDFDLSELAQNGVQSDNAMDIINNFLNLLGAKQNDLATGSNILDSIFAKASASIEGDAFSIFADNNINLEKDSNAIKGQIVQHAKITLDNATANQCPNIAINIL